MIIDRYFAKEILQSLFAVLVVLLLIFMGRYFARYLAWAAEGFIPGSIVVKMLFLRTIAGLNMILPFGFFLAVLLAFGRFYNDSEMTALSATGFSLARVMKSVIIIGLFVATIVAIFSLYVVPWAHEKAIQIQEYAAATPIIDSISEGRFNEVGSPSNSVFYAQRFSEDGVQMFDVFVKIQNKDGSLEIFTAREGVQTTDKKTGDRYLELRYGYQYEGTPGRLDFVVHKFQKSAIRITPRQIQQRGRGVRTLPTSVIWNSDDPKHVAEIQWRLSLPISTLILALLAVLLSKTTPRQGRYAKLFISILVFVVYNNGIGLAKSWVEQSQVPSYIGIWWLHAIFIVIIYLLYRRQNKRITLFSRG
ncbi:MAG: LPS export ABC transporter permease LptF [Thiohalomonadales bacterium]